MCFPNQHRIQRYIDKLCSVRFDFGISGLRRKGSQGISKCSTLNSTHVSMNVSVFSCVSSLFMHTQISQRCSQWSRPFFFFFFVAPVLHWNVEIFNQPLPPLWPLDTLPDTLPKPIPHMGGYDPLDSTCILFRWEITSSTSRYCFSRRSFPFKGFRPLVHLIILSSSVESVNTFHEKCTAVHIERYWAFHEQKEV